jgi:hypothetical protein
MTVFTNDNFIASPGVAQNSHQVAHRAAGDKQSRFFAKHIGRFLLESVNSRVFPINIIPQQSLGHCLHHLRRRPGNGIRPKINLIHYKILCKKEGIGKDGEAHI